MVEGYIFAKSNGNSPQQNNKKNKLRAKTMMRKVLCPIVPSACPGIMAVKNLPKTSSRDLRYLCADLHRTTMSKTRSRSHYFVRRPLIRRFIVVSRAFYRASDTTDCERIDPVSWYCW
jgi:hypothetical protein